MEVTGLLEKELERNRAMTLQGRQQVLRLLRRLGSRGKDYQDCSQGSVHALWMKKRSRTVNNKICKNVQKVPLPALGELWFFDDQHVHNGGPSNLILHGRAQVL